MRRKLLVFQFGEPYPDAGHIGPTATLFVTKPKREVFLPTTRLRAFSVQEP
jgi:hypothetical protein